jgi:hypothetical protein
MVTIKDFEDEDILPINAIFEGQSVFGIPSLKNVVKNATFLKEEKIIGYGVIKLFAEGFLILDSELDLKSRSQAVREALKTMIVYAKDAGLEQLFVISNTESYTKILRKKYGFKAVPGELLMLNLEEESDG